MTASRNLYRRIDFAHGARRMIRYDCFMWRSIGFAILVGAWINALFASRQSAAEEQVDVALVLAVDVSRSMSPEELHLQRKGYAAAISSPQVVRAIGLGAHGRIALTMFEWANNGHAREIVGWSIVHDQKTADQFAAKLLESQSFGQRRTSISGAIRHGTRLLKSVPFLAERLVLDISGDGPNNQGAPVAVQRDRAVESGVVINGLPLMTTGGFGSQFNIPDLDAYYRNCVIGGPGSFMIPVNDWDQFPEAVRRKLILEIGGFTPYLPAKVQTVQFDFRTPYDCLVGEKIWQKLRQQFYLDP